MPAATVPSVPQCQALPAAAGAFLLIKDWSMRSQACRLGQSEERSGRQHVGGSAVSAASMRAQALAPRQSVPAPATAATVAL